MFGLGFGELLVVMIVAVVVLGPKDLPRYMRKAGQMAARLRRLAFDMREKSGIDEMLRAEGLDREIAELRRLARGEINGVIGAVRSTADAVRPELAATVAALSPTGASASSATAPGTGSSSANPQRAPVPTPAMGEPAPPTANGPGPALFTSDREYPLEGPDSYGALPGSSNVYGGDLPASDLATDPVYTRGEEGPPAATRAVPIEARS